MKGFRLSKVWYYILSFTWGLPLNLIGIICAIALYLLGHRPEKNIYGWAFRLGKNWGGINLGVISILPESASGAKAIHEFGHSIQACIFGPFIFIFVAIPSLIRYWFRCYQEDVKRITDLPDYEYAWFESQATMFGERYQDLK